MTKYILNSGSVKKYPEFAKNFFAEVVKGLGNNPKILICCFAQPREDWETKFKEDADGIPKFFPEGVKPILSLALPLNFEEQIQNSDAIFIHGGDDHLIQYWFNKLKIPKIWEGKVVVTSSASSNALARHFWTCDWRQNMDGLGILPIKFFPHFKSTYGDNDPRGPIDWNIAYQELQAYADRTLPIHALKEGEFIVIEQ